MGNSLAFAKAKRKFAVDAVLDELPGYTFAAALNSSGRFLKCVRCDHAQGPVVVKVFTKRGSVTDLSDYEPVLREPAVRTSLATAPNVLPYAMFVETESTGFTARMYVYKDLVDRLSTRPFLVPVEKLWIAYQILAGLAQMADAGLCHGDIKTENVVVTSWGWAWVTDLADGIKPTALPSDNPVDFSFFFDSSGRRACFVAPERFYDRDADGELGHVPTRLTTAMDVYSAGCVIAELFLEDTPLFTLAESLAYREGNFDPAPRLAALDSPDLVDWILSMVARDPGLRPSPAQLLASPIFPSYFGSTLHPLLADAIAANPDDRIRAVSVEFPELMAAVARLDSVPCLPPSRLAHLAPQDPLGLGSGTADDGARAAAAPRVSLAPPPAIVPTMRVGRDTASAFRDLQRFISVLESEGDVPLDVAAAAATAGDAPPMSPSSPPLSSSLLSEGGAATRAADKGHPLPVFSQVVHPRLGYETDKTVTDDGALIVLSLMCSSLSGARYPISRIAGLDALAQGSLFVSDAFVLERLVPYTLSLVGDKVPAVRAAVIESLAAQVDSVRSLPRAEVNVFDEHILPGIEGLETDGDVLVRTALARGLARFAHAGLRFLELGQVFRTGSGAKDVPLSASRSLLAEALASSSLGGAGPLTFDTRAASLAEAIKAVAMTLLTDPEPVVRRALLPHLASLASFFNRSGSSAFLLSHMITYLNDHDWHLRAEFFEHVVSVAAAARVGTSGVEQFLVPLLHIGLNDDEDFVVVRAMACLAALTRLGLLSRPQLAAAVGRVVHHLGSENPWIRSAVVSMLTATAEVFDTVDIHCVLLPLLRPHTTRPLPKLTGPAVLDALRPPIPADQAAELVRTLSANAPGLRSLLHALDGAGAAAGPTLSSAAHVSDLAPVVHAWYAREALAWDTSAGDEGASGSGVALVPVADLVEGDGPVAEAIVHMHAMYVEALQSSGVDRGCLAQAWACLPYYVGKGAGTKPGVPDTTPLTASMTLSAFAPVRTVSVPVSSIREYSSSRLDELLDSANEAAASTRGRRSMSVSEMAAMPGSFAARRAAIDLGSVEAAPSRDGFASWAPSGVLVHHLAEHSGPVTTLAVSGDSVFFASGSADGSVRVWDTQALESTVASGSVAVHQRSVRGPGPAAPVGVTTLDMISASHSVVAGYTDGAIEVVRVDYMGGRGRAAGALRDYKQPSRVRRLETGAGPILGVHPMSTSESVLVYTTRSGSVCGWDLRSPDLAWRLDAAAEHGLLTASMAHPTSTWVATGTAKGVVSVWDIRFPLPVVSWGCPGGEAVTSMAPYPSLWRGSWLVVGSGRSNAVSVWDMDTGLCTQSARVVYTGARRGSDSRTTPAATLLSGPASRVDAAVARRAKALGPAASLLDRVHEVLARDLPPDHATYALHSPASTNYVLAGGGQRCIRLWDLASPSASYMVSDGSRSHATPPEYATMMMPQTSFISEIHASAGSELVGSAELGPDEHAGPAVSIGDGMRGRSGSTATKTRARARARIRTPTSTSPRGSSPAGPSAGSGGSGGSGGNETGSSSGTGAAAGSSAAGGSTVRGPRPPPVHHLDSILSIASVELPARCIVSGSRDGVIKIWK